MQIFRKKMEFWETERKCPWTLMRKTRIPNSIPIGQWKKDENSEEPKSGEKKIFLQVQICFKNASFPEKKFEFWETEKIVHNH